MTNVTQSHAQLTSSLLQLHLYEEHHRVETCNLPLILAQNVQLIKKANMITTWVA